MGDIRGCPEGLGHWQKIPLSRRLRGGIFASSVVLSAPHEGLTGLRSVELWRSGQSFGRSFMHLMICVHEGVGPLALHESVLMLRWVVLAEFCLLLN